VLGFYKWLHHFLVYVYRDDLNTIEKFNEKLNVTLPVKDIDFSVLKNAFETSVNAVLVRNGASNISAGGYNIDVSGDSSNPWDELIGFRYLGLIKAGDGAEDDFTGNLTGGNITVEMKGNTGSAFGALFSKEEGVGADLVGDNAGGQAQIKLGTITAKTKTTNLDEGAAGFVAGGLKKDALVDIEKIIVAGAGGYGIGVELRGDIEKDATLKVGGINIESGSGVPNKTKVSKITQEQVRKIAEQKMPDLNASSVEAAMKMVAGTARSMGVEVVEVDS